MKIYNMDSSQIFVMHGNNLMGKSYPAIEFQLDDISGIYLAVDDEHQNNVMKRCSQCNYELEGNAVLAVGNKRILLMKLCDECMNTNIALLPDKYPLSHEHEELKEVNFFRSSNPTFH